MKYTWNLFLLLYALFLTIFAERSCYPLNNTMWLPPSSEFFTDFFPRIPLFEQASKWEGGVVAQPKERQLLCKDFKELSNTYLTFIYYYLNKIICEAIFFRGQFTPQSNYAEENYFKFVLWSIVIFVTSDILVHVQVWAVQYTRTFFNVQLLFTCKITSGKDRLSSFRSYVLKSFLEFILKSKILSLQLQSLLINKQRSSVWLPRLCYLQTNKRSMWPTS